MEFQVNSQDEGSQFAPDVDQISSGEFVVVWVQRYAGDSVRGRLFDSTGAPVSEFPVSTGPESEEVPFAPAVAMDDASGSFVVVWSSAYGFGTFEAYGQVFDSVGSRVGAEFSLTSGAFARPKVDVFLQDSGEFLAVWSEDLTESGSSSEIHAQLYDTSGDPIGAELGLIDSVFELQALAATGQADGDFVVVWANYTNDSTIEDVAFRHFSSAGTPQTTTMRLNQITAGEQGARGVGVAVDEFDEYLVVWSGENIDSSQFAVAGRRVDSNGVASGAEFQVNTYEVGSQGIRGAEVAYDKGNGEFLVTWAGANAQDGSELGVFAQRILTDGNAVGTEFQVNTYTTNDQGGQLEGFPDGLSVASGGSGEFVVTWMSETQDTFDEGVFGQRLGLGGN